MRPFFFHNCHETCCYTWLLLLKLAASEAAAAAAAAAAAGGIGAATPAPPSYGSVYTPEGSINTSVATPSAPPSAPPEVNRALKPATNDIAWVQFNPGWHDCWLPHEWDYSSIGWCDSYWGNGMPVGTVFRCQEWNSLLLTLRNISIFLRLSRLLWLKSCRHFFQSNFEYHMCKDRKCRRNYSLAIFCKEYTIARLTVLTDHRKWTEPRNQSITSRVPAGVRVTPSGFGTYSFPPSWWSSSSI